MGLAARCAIPLMSYLKKHLFMVNGACRSVDIYLVRERRAAVGVCWVELSGAEMMMMMTTTTMMHHGCLKQ